MPPTQPSIDQFVAYVQHRGIADRFEPLYRSVVQDVLRRFRLPSLGQLDAGNIKAYVEEEERRLQNVRAVCVALEAYFRDLARRAEAERRTPPSSPPGRELPAPKKDEAPAGVEPRPSAAFTTPGANEQRRYVRIPFVQAVTVEGSVDKRASADLSIGGMYIEMDAYIPVGTVLRVTFKLEEGDPRITLDARVVHEDPGGGVGLSFINPSRIVQERIQDYIEEYVARRAAEG